MKVVSIGYERRDVQEFLDIVIKYKVKKLIDIRELPLSRRKGFSKNSLASSLNTIGVEYYHVRLAGNPYRKEKDDIQHCLNMYKKYLRKNPGVIDLVIEELSKPTVAILCYERDHEKCHRSVLIDMISDSNERINVVKAE